MLDGNVHPGHAASQQAEKLVWYPIVRYDTTHGNPHRDLIHADGSETKDWFNLHTLAEVLTIGQRDIMDNWLVYWKQFEQELKK